MKKSVIFASAVMAMALLASSCQGTKHADTVRLSKESSSHYSPAIDGTLAQYYSVVPADSVVLNLADSLLNIDVTFNLTTPYKEDKYTVLTIANGKELKSQYPYLVLTDSVGTPIENIIFEMDTTQMGQLRKLMSGEANTQMKIHFRTNNKLAQETWDSIAPVAVNYKVVANTHEAVDTSMFDTLLDKYQRAINELREINAGFGPMGPSTSMMASLQAPYLSSCRMAKKAAQAQYDKMTDEQKARFDKLKAMRQ